MQKVLKPSADATTQADNGTTASPASGEAADESADESKYRSSLNGLMVIRDESFVESLDPRHSLIMAVCWFILALTIIAAIINIVKGRGSNDSGFTEGPKRGNGISRGTILVCTTAAEDDAAKVFESPESEEAIDAIKLAGKVTAAGKPKDALRGFGSVTMIPIQPRGAVELLHFREEKGLLIKSGTLLTCADTDADVFLENSNVIIGKIGSGEKVVAKHQVFVEHGHTLVPIRPRGVVELDFFTVNHDEGEPPQEEAIAQWAKEQTEGTHELQTKVKTLRLEKGRLMMEQVSKQNKLKNIVEEMLVAEAELEGKAKPTDEEIQRQAQRAVDNAEFAANRNILMAVAYAAPMVHQSEKIYQAVEKSVQQVKDKGRELIYTESKEALRGLQDVLGFEDLTEMENHFLNDINVPSMAAILASMMAPVQLGLVYAIQNLFLILSVLWMILDTIALITDWRAECMCKAIAAPPPGSGFHGYLETFYVAVDHNHVYLWFFIDFIVHFVCLCIRVPTCRSIGKRLEAARAPPKVDEEEVNTNPVAVLRNLYLYYATSGTLALVELDVTLSSTLLYLSNWSVLYDTCWLLYGTDLVWNTPRVFCPTAGLVILRIRCTVFQTLCFLYVLQLVLFAFTAFSSSNVVTTKVIAWADAYDQRHFPGFPIAKVIAHALMVRHSSDMIQIQLQIHKMEKQRVMLKKEEAEEKLKEITGWIGATNQAIDKLEQESLEKGARFQDAAVLQEQYDEMHGQMINKSMKFEADINKRSAKATGKAIEQVEKWERGEGDELVQAFMKGEGMDKLAEYAAEVEVDAVARAVDAMGIDESRVQAARAAAQAAADNCAGMSAEEMQKAAEDRASALQEQASQSAASVLQEQASQRVHLLGADAELGADAGAGG
jgi:hypothetical protein